MFLPAVLIIGLSAVLLAGCGPSPGPAPETPPEKECFPGGEPIEMFLPAHSDMELSVPELPDEQLDYAYATDDAVIAIPALCVNQHTGDIPKYQPLTDRGGKTGMAYAYVKDLANGWDTVKLFEDCACGLIIEMHGSGGPGWTAIQFGALFSGMGFVQVVLNSQAMPDSYNLKGKLPMKAIEDVDTSNYCGSYSAFDGSCSSFNKPYCYSTAVNNILHDETSYRQYVEGIYQIRKRELDYFVAHKHSLLNDTDWDIYLVGNSEGAMAASRYHHPVLDAELSGRILTAWSCDFNYYVSCADHARICGDMCDKSVPQLNVIGDVDGYFGPQSTSTASEVAGSASGYGGPITGNCRAQYNAQNFERSTVVVMSEAGHGPSYYNDNTWRNVVADFFTNSGQSAETWKGLENCTETAGVYTCPMDGPVTCDDDYNVNENATFNEVSTFTCPQRASAEKKRMVHI